MKQLFFTLTFLLTLNSFCQNPIVPTGMYIADPEAHTWNDGKIYIYGSRDESDDYWCSYQHHVLFSSDLKNWNSVENSIASKGDNDLITYHDKLLFAPDCGYADGNYYLYYCSPGKPKTIGVAYSKSPLGPFINGTHIDHAKSIDPAILTDTDGQSYLYWGQAKPLAAKLKSNLSEIDESTIVYPLDEAGNKAFHEGSSIRKIGKLYYFVFADESRNKRPTCLGYAIGESPLGPFTYKGVLIDNTGCDPAVWNNHGSIEQFKDKWYVFYHRSTHNSQKFRKACIEPLVINADGTIDEVEMTSQGAHPPLPASSIIEAEQACLVNGGLYIQKLPSKDIASEGLVNISNNNWAAYKYINFNEELNIRIKSNHSKGGSVELRIDAPTGKKIGVCNILKSWNKGAYQISETKIKPIKGKHALYLVFKGVNSELFELDWFQFY